MFQCIKPAATDALSYFIAQLVSSISNIPSTSEDILVSVVSFVCFVLFGVFFCFFNQMFNSANLMHDKLYTACCSFPFAACKWLLHSSS